MPSGFQMLEILRSLIRVSNECLSSSWWPKLWKEEKTQSRSYLESAPSGCLNSSRMTTSEYTYLKYFFHLPLLLGKLSLCIWLKACSTFSGGSQIWNTQEHRHRNGRKRRSSPTLAGVNCWPSDSKPFGKEPALSPCWRASWGNGCDDSKGVEQNTGRCPLPGSTYFLPFICPPSVEWTQRGLAGALWLRSSVWVALGLSGYFVCSQLTAHISPPHALATGHWALKGQECVSGSFGSFGGGSDHRGGEGHRSGDRIPNPMTLTAITRLSNFQWKGPKRMS